MKGKTPTLISGVPKVAFSPATTRSQASASPSAPARQWPLTAQITGLPSSPMTVKSRGKRSVADMLVHERHVGREAGEVPARAEGRLVRGGEHDAAHRVVVARRLEGGDEVGQQLVGQRVARVRLVHGDGGHAAVGATS